jgi:hypothetical protein
MQGWFLPVGRRKDVLMDVLMEGDKTCFSKKVTGLIQT